MKLLDVKNSFLLTNCHTNVEIFQNNMYQTNKRIKRTTNRSFITIVSNWNETIYFKDYPVLFHPSVLSVKLLHDTNFCKSLLKNIKYLLHTTESLSVRKSPLLEINSIEMLSSVISRSSNTEDIHKVRLSKEFCKRFSNVLFYMIPPAFTIQEMNNQPIIFYNEEVTVCETHFDRDYSILLVVQGKKDVLLAPKDIIQKSYKDIYTFPNESGMHPLMLPFDEDETIRSKKGWIHITIEAGQCMYLPPKVLHSIKSSKNTLAISFQVIENNQHRARIFNSRLYKNSTSFHEFLCYLHKYTTNY